MKRADLLQILSTKLNAGIKVGNFIFTSGDTICKSNGAKHAYIVYSNGNVYIPIQNRTKVAKYSHIRLDGDKLTIISPPWWTNKKVKTVITLAEAKAKHRYPEHELCLPVKIVELPLELLHRRFAGWEKVPKEIRKLLVKGSYWKNAIEWGTVPLFREKTRKEIANFLSDYKSQWKERRPCLWKDLVISWFADVCREKSKSFSCPPEIVEELF